MDRIFDFEIMEHIGTIAENEGYTKELNRVSWRGKDAVIDLRTWHNREDEKKPLKGITFSETEFRELRAILSGYQGD